jgi:MFS family permease
MRVLPLTLSINSDTVVHVCMPVMRRLAQERDALLICAAGFIRSAAVSLVGVTLAIHLAEVGFSTTNIGVFIGVGLAGSSLATVVVSVRGDRWGRRRVLVGLALLSAVGYLALGVFTGPWALAPLAFVGMLNGMGRDRGAASALDQAILPQTVPDRRRTWALAWYHVTLDAGHALGALAAAAPTVLMRVTDLRSQAAHQLTFLACAVAMLASIVPYLVLTPRIEVPTPNASADARPPLDPRSTRAISRLALLFGLDSIGGGFLNSALIAYWFFLQYGTSEADLAVLFFAARVLNALSHVGAAWLARRIGLLNTMVWTHLPSSLFLIAAPAAPTAAIASALFLAREGLVEMDVPTRQSYVMAVVRPSERTLASGVTNVTRNIAWAVGPSFAGLVMQHVALGGPLVIGAALKITYDLLLFSAFRHVRPPEEETAHRQGEDVRRPSV